MYQIQIIFGLCTKSKIFSGNVPSSKYFQQRPILNIFGQGAISKYFGQGANYNIFSQYAS